MINLIRSNMFVQEPSLKVKRLGRGDLKGEVLNYVFVSGSYLYQECGEKK